MKKFIAIAVAVLMSSVCSAEEYIHLPVILDNGLSVPDAAWGLSQSSVPSKHVVDPQTGKKIKEYSVSGFLKLFSSVLFLQNDGEHIVSCRYYYPLDKKATKSIEDQESAIFEALVADNDVLCSGGIFGSVDFTGGVILDVE